MPTCHRLELLVPEAMLECASVRVEMGQGRTAVVGITMISTRGVASCQQCRLGPAVQEDAAPGGDPLGDEAGPRVCL